MITKHRKRARLPPAPRTRLPELAEFLAPLRVHFTQGPSAETLRQYLTGLLSEHPNKNCDTLAAVVAETNEQQFNHLLTDMVWDENALNRQRIARMQTLASEGDGVLIFDDTGFEKRGHHSVGVARQDWQTIAWSAGVKAGGGPSFARYAAGGWMVMAAAISAGCWGNAPVAASTGLGSIAGVISRPPHH